MKRIVLVFMLLVACCVSAQTDLYRRYAKQSHVKVASVSNFSISNDAQIDVTVIEAVDDEGWEWMMNEFYISRLQPEQMQNLREGSDVVTFARRSRSNPRDNAPVKDEQIDVAGSCYMGISYLNRAVYIFCADSEEQYDAIVTLLVKKIMRSGR